MPATVKGTFNRAGEISAEIESFGGFRLFARGLDANNTIRLERSTTDGQSWSTVTTYNSDQNATAITETTVNGKHRLVCATKQDGTNVRFKMTTELPTNDVQ